MGQARQRGSKEERVVEAEIRRKELDTEVEKLRIDQQEQLNKWNEEYEANLPYRERVARHNVKVMMQSLSEEHLRGNL